MNVRHTYNTVIVGTPGHRFPPPPPRRWNDRNTTVATLIEAKDQARREWAANFDQCHGAFVSEAVYIKSRCIVLAGYWREGND